MDLHSNLLYSKGYIMLPIQVSLAPRLKIQDVEFVAKKEFHISILATKKYVPILANKLQLSEEQSLNRLLSEVDKFVSQSDITFKSFTKEIRMAKREDRTTLIILVKIKNIDALYERLRDVFQIDFEIQPTHVTLYTLENGLGIGLNSKEELNGLSSKLTEAEALPVIKALNI